MNTHRNVIKGNENPTLALVNNVIDMNDSKISEAVLSFLDDKKKRNTNTYKSYKSDVDHFFLNHFNKKFSEVTFNELNGEKTDIEQLIGYFNILFESFTYGEKRAFSNSTINRKQTTVKQLLKFLKMKKVLIKDLTDLEFINQFPKDTETIEMIPFEVALKYAEWFKKNEVEKPLEKYLITKLAIDSGLRATELIKLKWNQFTVDSDIVIIRGIGKGNKKWVEKISLDFYNELEELKKADTRLTDNLFTIKYHTIPNMMNRAKKALGHDGKNYSFHSFKKTSVSMTYRLTGDILECQRKGRHASLDTTRIYLQEEEYGMTGLISLGGDVPTDLYKTVDHDCLVEAIEEMNKDFLFILNHKISEKIRIKNI